MQKKQEESALTLEHLTNECTAIFELIDTILEAAQHGDHVPSAKAEMKKAMAEGITVVWKQIMLLSPQLKSELEAQQEQVLAVLHQDSEQSLCEMALSCLNPAVEPLLKEVLENLQDQTQVSKTLAEKLEHLILEKVPVATRMKAGMLLNLGLKCGIWAPEIAWRCIMQAAKMYPRLMQNKGVPSLKEYVYEPDKHAQTEMTHCPVCGGAGTPYLTACSCLINTFEPMFLPAKMWMKCEKCGNLYSRYFPTEFLKLGGHPFVCQPNRERMVICTPDISMLHIWGQILKKICTYTSGRDLLEVGVGEGNLIAAAQELGMQVSAVEILQSSAQETADLLDLPVICGDFLHLPEEHTYSIITMGDVLEHLQRPVDGLKKAHTLLKENGILWLSTPNYNSAHSRMIKSNDAMWCEPFHISYFSRETLLPILEQVGFELLEYTISIRYKGSMELLLRKKSTV